jgi:hypothetical protein
MEDRKPITLDELVAQNAELILRRLIRELKESGGPTYQRIPLGVLQSRVHRLFDAFWQAVSQKDPKPLTEYVRATGRERGHEGFSVAELHNVAIRLRDALLELVDEVYADDPELRLHNSRNVEELIFGGISAGVQGFVDGREALIARQSEALRRNNDTQA